MGRWENITNPVNGLSKTAFKSIPFSTLPLSLPSCFISYCKQVSFFHFICSATFSVFLRLFLGDSIV